MKELTIEDQIHLIRHSLRHTMPFPHRIRRILEKQSESASFAQTERSAVRQEAEGSAKG